MLLRFAALCALLVLPFSAHADDTRTLTAPDGSTVDIVRDEYGVPKIYASTEVGAFYAQGWAVAQDRLFQMETFWRTATGRMSEIQGAAALPTDQAIRTVYYTRRNAPLSSRISPSPSKRCSTPTSRASTRTSTSRSLSQPSTSPTSTRNSRSTSARSSRWNRDKAVATMQFFMRRFGEIGGQELSRLAELQANGPEWFEANRPINDPAAYTSLRGGARSRRG